MVDVFNANISPKKMMHIIQVNMNVVIHFLLKIFSFILSINQNGVFQDETYANKKDSKMKSHRSIQQAGHKGIVFSLTTCHQRVKVLQWQTNFKAVLTTNFCNIHFFVHSLIHSNYQEMIL